MNDGQDKKDGNSGLQSITQHTSRQEGDHRLRRRPQQQLQDSVSVHIPPGRKDIVRPGGTQDIFFQAGLPTVVLRRWQTDLMLRITKWNWISILDLLWFVYTHHGHQE